MAGATAPALSHARSEVVTSPVIDPGLPVAAGACIPCHESIGVVKRPGLVFDHSTHLMVGCAACHYRMSHQNGLAYAPPMETCFNCHGVAHGPHGEIASRECSKCHTKSFTLRPRWHTKDWAKKPHATRANRDPNTCLMCHDAPEDCDRCHRELELDIPAIYPLYEPVLPVSPRQPPVKVTPYDGVTPAECLYCHTDVDDFPKGRTTFKHASHLQMNFRCTVCHPTFAHLPQKTLRPSMTSCYRCHGTVHSAQGLIAPTACQSCHPKEFELTPKDHTKAFLAKEHGKPANSDPSICAMCHEPEVCVECHTGRRQLPNGRYTPKVVPEGHKEREWVTAHGGLFLSQRGACGSCHDSNSCKRCHVTAMPHPTEWLVRHPKEAKGRPKDCKVCHADRYACEQCHHKGLEFTELVAKNCVDCHPEMKQKPATAIKNKAFAEHAVHFEVAKKKDRPHVCDDCHLGFDLARDQGLGSAMTGNVTAHDVRLCYGCHGALDYRNVLIAPYPGLELCRRCHKDVRF